MRNNSNIDNHTIFKYVTNIFQTNNKMNKQDNKLKTSNY